MEPGPTRLRIGITLGTYRFVDAPYNVRVRSRLIRYNTGTRVQKSTKYRVKRLSKAFAVADVRFFLSFFLLFYGERERERTVV